MATRGSRQRDLPAVIVTGASGFAGTNFFEAAWEEFLICALAHRNRKDSGAAIRRNSRWLHCDMGDSEMVKRAIASIAVTHTQPAGTGGY